MAAPSQFEVGSSSAIVLDPVSEATTFFVRFDQPEVNDLDLADFRGARLLTLIFTASRFLRSAFPIWRQSIATVETSCKGFFSAVLQGRIS